MQDPPSRTTQSTDQFNRPKGIRPAAVTNEIWRLTDGSYQKHADETSFLHPDDLLVESSGRVSRLEPVEGKPHKFVVIPIGNAFTICDKILAGNPELMGRALQGKFSQVSSMMNGKDVVHRALVEQDDILVSSKYVQKHGQAPPGAVVVSAREAGAAADNNLPQPGEHWVAHDPKHNTPANVYNRWKKAFKNVRDYMRYIMVIVAVMFPLIPDDVPDRQNHLNMNFAEVKSSKRALSKDSLEESQEGAPDAQTDAAPASNPNTQRHRYSQQPTSSGEYPGSEASRSWMPHTEPYPYMGRGSEGYDQPAQSPLMQGILVGMQIERSQNAGRHGGRSRSPYRGRGGHTGRGGHRPPTGGRIRHDASYEEQPHGRSDLTNYESTALPNEHMLQDCMDVTFDHDDVTSVSQACQSCHCQARLQHASLGAHAANPSDEMIANCQVTDEADQQFTTNADRPDQFCGKSNKAARLDHCIADLQAVDATCKDSMQEIPEQVRKRKLADIEGIELTRVKRTARKNVSGHSAKRRCSGTLTPYEAREPAAPIQSEEARAIEIATADDYDDVWDIGLTGRFISCTGMVVTMLARWRTALWRRDVGGADSYYTAVPSFLHPTEPSPYDWSLHALLLQVLQRPGQHSFMHSAMCVPFFSMQVHGREQQYIEPDFPFTPVETHIPIPGASYGCYMAQSCYIHEYLKFMNAELPGVSKFGSEEQRAMQAPNAIMHDYDENRLARAAKRCSIRAMSKVDTLYGQTPLMGHTRHEATLHESMFHHEFRQISTDVYQEGAMQFVLPDCPCQTCDASSVKQRFPHESDNDPEIRYDSE